MGDALEAVLQYGAERVARYLRVEIADGEPSAQSIPAGMSATPPPQGDTMATAPLPEMQWFPPTRVVA